MATYSGNQFGTRQLFVFSATGGTNANFVTTIATSGTTEQYRDAGGSTFPTGASLSPFLGNSAYLAFKRTEKATITELLPDGGITSTNNVNSIPDPRIVFGVIATDSITGHHMDEIHFTANSGSTYQAFLGRLTYHPGTTYGGGSTLVPPGKVLVDLVAPGISGAEDTGVVTLNLGATLVNKTNGMSDTGCTIANITPLFRVSTTDYRNAIKTQVASSTITTQLNASGLTGITVGDTTHIRSTRINPYSKDLQKFIAEASVITSTATAVTGDANRQSTIFTSTAVSGDGTTYGIQFNAITGGTVSGTSELAEFIGKATQKKVEIDNSIQTTIESLNAKKTVRGVDEVSF